MFGFCLKICVSNASISGCLICLSHNYSMPTGMADRKMNVAFDKMAFFEWQRASRLTANMLLCKFEEQFWHNNRYRLDGSCGVICYFNCVKCGIAHTKHSTNVWHCIIHSMLIFNWYNGLEFRFAKNNRLWCVYHRNWCHFWTSTISTRFFFWKNSKLCHFHQISKSVQNVSCESVAIVWKSIMREIFSKNFECRMPKMKYSIVPPGNPIDLIWKICQFVMVNYWWI